MTNPTDPDRQRLALSEFHRQLTAGVARARTAEAEWDAGQPVRYWPTEGAK